MTARIVVLPGDGIGPEITEIALSFLTALAPVELVEAPIGGAAIDLTGDPLPPVTLDLCRHSSGVLVGAVGGPRWEAAPLPAVSGLLRLRRELGVFATVRPARYMGLPTPLREGLARHADLVIVRELLGGVYYAEPRSLGAHEAVNTWRQTADQIRRAADLAFRLAQRRRRRVTSVDKSNVLEASRLWRTVVTDVGASYPEVQLEHVFVDAMAFELIRAPHHYDVILADNLFGDILSNEAAVVAGSLSLLPSACLGPGPGVYQPLHGPMHEIAGRRTANPTGAILAVALLLEHALSRPDLARALETAVFAAIHEGVRTPDVGGHASSRDFARAVHRQLAWSRAGEGEPAFQTRTEWGV
jgi:3-isopropylmalate dehydrogenase